jgi:hypothetical protein
MSVFVLVLTLSVIGTACIAIGCLICLTLQAKKLSAATHQTQIGGNSSYPTFPLAPSAFSVTPQETSDAAMIQHPSVSNIAPKEHNSTISPDLPPSYEQAISNSST